MGPYAKVLLLKLGYVNNYSHLKLSRTRTAVLLRFCVIFYEENPI